MKALFLASFVAVLSSAELAKAELESSYPEQHREQLQRRQRDMDRLGWYVPDFAKLQTAGYLGSVGVGFGYALFNDITNVSLLYGFTPRSRAGDDVHAARLSIDVRPLDFRIESWRIVPLYLGGSLLYAFGGEYFTRVPERYQRLEKNYYPPTSLHWGAELGVELDYVPTRGPFERHGLYYEVVALDTYLSSYFENSSLHLVDVMASTVGYRCAF
jgi:hypothetical protein